MGKGLKRKKNKVPKLTEEEYIHYVNSLKSPREDNAVRIPTPLQARETSRWNRTEEDR